MTTVDEVYAVVRDAGRVTGNEVVERLAERAGPGTVRAALVALYRQGVLGRRRLPNRGGFVYQAVR